jgi:hypothetical protein
VSSLRGVSRRCLRSEGEAPEDHQGAAPVRLEERRAEQRQGHKKSAPTPPLLGRLAVRTLGLRGNARLGQHGRIAGDRTAQGHGYICGRGYAFLLRGARARVIQFSMEQWTGRISGALKRSRNFTQCVEGQRQGTWARGGIQEARLFPHDGLWHGEEMSHVSASFDARQTLRNGAIHKGDTDLAYKISPMYRESLLAGIDPHDW